MTIQIDKTIAGKTIREYLREHIHQYGRIRTSRQLLIDMTGEDFNPD